jgi:hypothetical protein
VESNTNFQSKAAARFELECREREDAERQEQSRRTFETGLVDKQLRAANDVAWARRGGRCSPPAPPRWVRSFKPQSLSPAI